MRLGHRRCALSDTSAGGARLSSGPGPGRAGTDDTRRDVALASAGVHRMYDIGLAGLPDTRTS